jgi:ELWxxDGT repeat protein
MAVELSDDVRPTHCVSAGSLLFFAAGAFGGERGLWATDGTPAGTRRLSSDLFQPGSHQELVGVNGTLYFRHLVTSALWKSDGTEAGTAEVRDREGQPVRLTSAYNLSGFRVFAGRLYFINQVGALVESDGTPAGTSVILEKAGPDLLPLGNRLYLGHWERETGRELWALE